MLTELTVYDTINRVKLFPRGCFNLKKATALLLSFFMIFTLFNQTICHAEPISAETLGSLKSEVNLDEFTISHNIDKFQFDRVKELHKQMY